MKRLIMDLDNTITLGDSSDYSSVSPNLSVIQKMQDYRDLGFEIAIFTARNMRTHKGNIGKITVHTVPTILAWLEKHSVPFDELIVGKPWCGTDGFYVDDRAIRPGEFVSKSHHELMQLIHDDSELARQC